MNPARLIACTRDGLPLTDEQIAELVRGYVAGDIQDYQMSAWAMAVYLRGLTSSEIIALTRAKWSGPAIRWTKAIDPDASTNMPPAASATKARW